MKSQKNLIRKHSVRFQVSLTFWIGKVGGFKLQKLYRAFKEKNSEELELVANFWPDGPDGSSHQGRPQHELSELGAATVLALSQPD